MGKGDPESWPFFQELSDLATERCCKQPFILFLSFRRLIQGTLLPEQYQHIVNNAEQCGALVQLEPLGEIARNKYLKYTLGADLVFTFFLALSSSSSFPFPMRQLGSCIYD